MSFDVVCSLQNTFVYFRPLLLYLYLLVAFTGWLTNYSYYLISLMGPSVAFQTVLCFQSGPLYASTLWVYSVYGCTKLTDY